MFDFFGKKEIKALELELIKQDKIIEELKQCLFNQKIINRILDVPHFENENIIISPRPGRLLEVPNFNPNDMHSIVCIELSLKPFFYENRFTVNQIKDYVKHPERAASEFIETIEPDIKNYLKKIFNKILKGL